ncbi:peptidase S8 and S53 [Streptomyces davaonensis JCM 4913]|uniref:Peptidase S8 and S53 n=1 Tax=Streptomyces davaonensis (strain DSM 101723 / JCM 4913 / KCC S-0913 / 768) TaxID=1214101 RepID=K4QZM4_STRDJ|nr:S8 family serine peptidase [Streptomyces davaonensis]CCK26543.1 peptidase S8 and S53 [Streptomyces davaonensis JCM 4913]
MGRAISRTALGAATAAVLAVTAAVPTQASDGGPRALTGSPAATGAGSVVTLVTGDRVLVTKDGAVALPGDDGRTPFTQTRRSGDDLYVYPESAVEALAAGRVDEELFNVTGLVRQGYDDAHRDTLPLIATYGTDAVPRALPRGAERGLTLDAIDGVALEADKEQAAGFWSEVTKSRGPVRKLWLDAKVEATLDRSTRQVNAPEAWAAGYDGKGTKVAVLDTGVDAEHPDLKGRIAASKNFTDSQDASDRDGHGTHTTSTVGGSGSASDGKKKGVAPGAELLNGKVLNDYGYGETSWIIAGMQWAVDEGADVVSMSLGNPARTDCSDPMALAAEELARTSENTLFVIAAGNTGPGNNTVSSPGCAPGVLTVGAVDRDDSTASFSSRGPVYGAHTLKPEITAPGVGISAANAGGRGVYAYQSMSGTSMATPHVAGAAAIVSQRHPDWSAQRVKAALVSSAETGIPGDVRATGGGRLDVRAAVEQTVLGAPAVQGGTFDWPQHPSDRTTVTVPYTNTSDEPVKLRLSVAGVTGNDGSAVRARIARLTDRTVTVPAGGTAEVPLTLDPTATLTRAQYGDITGRVLATADGVTVSTPFALYVQPETVTLRVKLLDRLGKPADGSSSVDLIGTDDASGERRFNEGATDQTYAVRPGSYFLSSFITTPQAEGTLVDSLAYLARPQLEIRGDTTVVLDAREAHRLEIDTDRPAEVRSATLGFARSWDDTWLHAGTAAGGRTLGGYYASVTGLARDGDFEFDSFWRAAAPQISELAVVGGPSLHPTTGHLGSANLDGAGQADLYDAKSGTAQELSGAKGRIALVRLPDGDSAGTVATRAQAAGAVALIVHRDAPGRWYPSVGFAGGPLPVLAVPADEAAALLAAGDVTLRWKAIAKSPYVYNLAFPESGPVRSERTYRVRDSDLAATRATYRSMAGTGTDHIDMESMTRPGGLSAYFGQLETVPAPFTRTEYHSTGDTAWRQDVSSSFPWGEFMVDPARTYAEGEHGTEEWYGGVVTPVTPLDDSGRAALAAERQGDLIGVAPGFWGDGQHQGLQGSFGDIGGMVLKRNGEMIGESPYPFGVFTVPAEDSAYELTLNTAKFGQPARVWKRSTSTTTTWSFRSALDEDVSSQGIPLLFPRYDLPEDGLKALPAEDGQRIALTATGHAGYQPGELTEVRLSYSYDEGETWTEARTVRRDGTWEAVVDHGGATGKPVTLRTELTDAKGNSVSQTVQRAYDVR